MKKLTVTIGIPAYNEEANIGYLIGDILRQKQVGISIKRIIVSSDGSTDRTVEAVKRFEKKEILLINNAKRQGLAVRENQIIKNTNSDILVFLNADTRIADTEFLEKLILPISCGKADLTAPHIIEIEPKRFFEKVLFASMKIKNFACEEFKDGDNVYTCHGQARAFSYKLYKKIHFSSSIGEDAYSYFYCISAGLKFKYVKDTDIIYKLPGNFSDHRKQSIRFFQSQNLQRDIFDTKLVKSEYRIPKGILMKSLLKGFMEFPFYASFYLFVVFYLWIKSYFAKNANDIWEIAISSKEIGNYSTQL